MKKKLAAFLIAFFMLATFTGCKPSSYEKDTAYKSGYEYGGGYFTIVSEWLGNNGTYRIVYANDTKVEYFIFSDGSRFGITPLYNADGTLQMYEESPE